MKLFIYFISIFLSFVATLSANETLLHEKIIVTAKRFSADEVDTEFQTGHVTIISSDQFEGDVATVADVLRKETGVQIRQSSGLGSYSSVSVRGSTSAQVNIYLDGVRINDARGGNVDLSQFLLSGVESIEIYRGNVPIQLGNAGIGGAINIKTKRSLKHDLRQVSLGFGSFGSKKASAILSTGDTGTRYLGSLELLSSDNDYELLNDNQTPNNPSDDRVERRQNAMFEHFSALLSMNHQLNEKLNFNSVLAYFDKTNGIPEVSNSTTNQASLDVQNATIQLKLEQSLSDQSALSYLFYAGQRNSLYDDTQNRIGLNADLEESVTDTFGFKSDFARNYGSHFINVGAQIRFEDYKNKDLLRGTSQALQRTEINLSLQDEWISATGKLLLSTRLSLRNLTDTLKTGTEKQDTRHYLDKHLGIRYQLNELSTLTANISHDIRIPNLYELYGDQGSTVGNEDLKEEQAWNADVGLKSKLSTFEVYSAFFYRQINEAIVMIYDSRGIGQPDNISKANLFGMEFELSKELLPGWSLALKATLQQSEDLSEIPSSRGNPLPGQYEKQASIINSWKIKDFAIDFEYAHLSGGNYDSAGVAPLQTSNQYHLSMNYTFDSHRFELQIKNLNDERIEDFNRYPGPGRRAFLTYAYTF